MTPMAYRIVKELTLPAKRRTFKDYAGLVPLMADMHCFELSEVIDSIESLAADLKRRPGAADTLAFLPAPRTWLEWKIGGVRRGIFLEEKKYGADFSMIWLREDGTFFSKFAGNLLLREALSAAGSCESVCRITLGLSTEESLALMRLVYAALALINTPRIFGRRQHEPHRGLARDLVRTKSAVGKFPLHAWTEIKLEITDPRETGESSSRSVHYTGERARHFCRTHLRIRLGKVELVPSHWRGNEALGIKHSRYRLTSKFKEEYVS